MKNVKNIIKLYLPFSKAGIKIELAYKAQIVMWIIISFVQTFFVLFLYNAIYKNYTAMVDYADGDSAEQDLVIKVSDKEYVVVKGAKMQDEVYDTEKEAVAALGVNGVKLYATENADVKDKVFVVCSKHEHAVCTDTKCKHCGYVMAAGTCTDSNADSKCDVCGADMPAEEGEEATENTAG